MNNIRYRLILLSFLLLAVSGSLQSQISAVQKTNTDAADKAWRDYPFMETLSGDVPTSDTTVETAQDRKRYAAIGIDNMVKRERYGYALIKFGRDFWKKFPTDPRRFEWLLNATGPAPIFWKNTVEGATAYVDNRYDAPIDTAARNRWLLQHGKFRNEFLHSPQTTQRMKDQLREYEFDMIYSNMKWIAGSPGGKFDIRALRNLMLAYAPYFFKRYEGTEDFKDRDFWKGHRLTMCIDNIFTEMSALKLDISTVASFLVSIEHSGFPYLENQAAEKLSLLKLRTNEFAFKGITIDGRSFDLSNRPGKYFLLDFWSTGCSSCVAMMPTLRKVYETYLSQGLEVVSICLNPDTDSNRVANIRRRIGANWPLFMIGGKSWTDSTSSGNRLFRKYGFKSVPQMILLDADRKLICYNDGLLFQDNLENFLLSKTDLVSAQQRNSQTGNQQFRLDFSLEGIADSTQIYLVNNQSDDTLQSAPMRGNHHVFTGVLDKTPEWISVRIKGNEQYPTFLLENSAVSMTGSYGSWPRVSIAGSKADSELRIYIDQSSTYNLLIDSATRQYNEYVNGIQAKILATKKDYIRENPSYPYAAWLIGTLPGLTTAGKDSAYHKLSAGVQNSNFGMRLKKNIDLTRIAENTTEGNRCADFTLPDQENKPVSLYEIVKKGRLTLVDFWASWCGPCREETPNAKKAFNRFHEKGFNIISVSLDENASHWKAAIKADEMNWYHVCDLKGYNSDMKQMFDLSHIPQTLLLDANGTILAKNLQGQELIDKIADIMGTR